MAGLEGAVGSVAMTIRIANSGVVWADDASVLAVYQEWQDTEDETTARQSSALFAIDSDAPGGLRWLWVHETWMER